MMEDVRWKMVYGRWKMVNVCLMNVGEGRKENVYVIDLLFRELNLIKGIK